MTGIGPLWAVDFGDIVGIILVILFVVVPAIGQLLAKKGQAKPGPAGGAARKPPRKGPFEDEIGEFLRRAVQRREAVHRQAPPPQPAPPVQAEIARPEIVRAEIVGEPAIAGRPERPLGSDFDKDFDSARFSRRAAELGKSVGNAEKQLEQHFHEKFDHQIGRLFGAPDESARVTTAQGTEASIAVPPTVAAGLAAMLGNTQSLRQAILLNEIIQRPEHRW